MANSVIESGASVSASPRKIVVVGLGLAGEAHSRALETIPDLTVIAGIDLDPSRSLTFRRRAVPVYPSVFDIASERQIDPDIVVVATPTSTHARVCEEVGEYFRKAAILVEKPAADNLPDAQRIVDGVGGKQPVQVAYHMAYSPEVEWGLREASRRAGQLGLPISIESWNSDPYQCDLASAQARLGTSWIDSGINAMSVVERFAKLAERTSLRQIGKPAQSMFEGAFLCEAQGARVKATIVTSWYSTAPSRSTRIRYSSGAELVMDHNAVAGYIMRNGVISSLFGSDGAVPRREAHYQALYKSWLIERNQLFSVDTSLRLHRLLLADEQEMAPA